MTLSRLCIWYWIIDCYWPKTWTLIGALWRSLVWTYHDLLVFQDTSVRCDIRIQICQRRCASLRFVVLGKQDEIMTQLRPLRRIHRVVYQFIQKCCNILILNILSDLIILSSSNVTFTLECIECGRSERRFFQVSVKDLNRTKEWNAKSQPTALREDFVHLAESSLRHRQIAIKYLAKEHEKNTHGPWFQTTLAKRPWQGPMQAHQEVPSMKPRYPRREAGAKKRWILPWCFHRKTAMKKLQNPCK